MEGKIVYFERSGEENTGAVFDLVDEAMAQTGIKKVVVASTRGGTARHAMDRYKGKGVRLIIVPHQYGSRPEQRFPEELVGRARAEGHEVLFSTMVLSMDALLGPSAGSRMSDSLRVFCQGFKVCVEILLMAGDAGLVGAGEQVIAVAGTGRGADTAMIATGSTTRDLKALHVSQILCKPL